MLSSFTMILDSDDMRRIKNLCEEMRDKICNQDALIKKLKFELEMEVGHVNILR